LENVLTSPVSAWSRSVGGWVHLQVRLFRWIG
jgi:hypothetical protein